MSSIALAQQLLAKEELHREQLSIEFVMSKADVAEVESVLFGVLQSVEMCRLIMWRCGAAEDETDAISSFESHVSSHVRKVIIAKMKKIGSLRRHAHVPMESTRTRPHSLSRARGSTRCSSRKG